jgi:hypothetical protein
MLIDIDLVNNMPSSILDAAEQSELRSAFLNVLDLNLNEVPSSSSSSPNLTAYMALNGPLEYSMALQLMLDIQLQLEFLANEWHAGILYFRLADIVVIASSSSSSSASSSSASASSSYNNNIRFLLADYAHFGDLDSFNPALFRLAQPMNFVGDFLAPELADFGRNNEKSLPFRPQKNVSQYSLAKLVQCCLGSLSHSPAFHLTKLGCLLRRCLSPSNNSVFLF